MGTSNGYSLFSINSTDSMDLVHQDGRILSLGKILSDRSDDSDDPDIYIAERLFSSSLVATVSNANPRTLQVCHFKKGTEICRYSYTDRIRAVRMNRSVSSNPAEAHLSLFAPRDWWCVWRRVFTSTTSGT